MWDVFDIIGYSCGSKLDVRPSLIPGSGLGLFASSFFAKGSFVTVYDGVVRHVSAMPAARDSFSCGPFTHAHKIPGTEYIVCGFRCVLFGRGLGSFSNHHRHNNARVVRLPGKYRYQDYASCPLLQSFLVLVTVCDIEPGAEIYVKYSKLTMNRLGILQ